MLFSQKLRRTATVASLFMLTSPVLYARASHVHRGTSSPKPHHRQAKAAVSGGSHVTSSARPRAIDDARATEIQSALVKAGYLQNTSGHWDEASADAMRKMQADNGWQTKLIPDSRALIKLGLGANTGNTPDSTANLAAPTE